MIRRTGQAGSEADFDVESAGVDVEDREQLMRLLRRWKKMADTAKVVVFLERHLVSIGHLHGHPGGGHEFKTRHPRVGVVDDGIENEIETADVSADDRADFGSVAPFVPMCGVEAEFEIDAIEYLAIGRVRGDEQGPQFE